MKVTIMYRNNWFGGDGWTYYPVTVEISDYCPSCGCKRGEPHQRQYCEDEEFRYLDNWTNPCGHIDKYKDCIIEARRIEDAKTYGNYLNLKINNHETENTKESNCKSQ